tara:strand:- start:1250 stop:1609 length:360 start_codon:yes stop_codon:yes gene_type:complete
MKKKLTSYLDLSNKQLQHLKEIYIQKKVDSMSNIELKEFVLEIITHQIIDTIGKEEEIEAWKEMSDFFGEHFDIVILEIQNKFKNDNNLKDADLDPQKQRIELIERNNIEKEKKDMWGD